VNKKSAHIFLVPPQNSITKKIFFLIAFCGVISVAHAQIFSTRGTDFWLAYGPHANMFNNDGSIDPTGGSQEMVLYFTTLADANITVEIPALGWSKNYFVGASSFTESDPLPKSGVNDARIDSEGVFNTGVHIYSDQPISVYCHIYANGSSASSLILPTYILGQNYNSLNFTQTSDDPNSYSYCFVVATEDSTTVLVTPAANTQTHAARTPFTQTLQRGQVLNLMGKIPVKTGNKYSGVDLTGTHIETMTDNTPVCKRIAVFSGSTSISINCDPAATSTSDNLIQEVFPAKAKGNEFITVPSQSLGNNYFRIYAPDTSIKVTFNGVLLTNLISGKYYQVQSNKPSVIEASSNVLVAQYITSQSVCGNTIDGNNGDPEMTYLSPTNQTFSTADFYSTNHFNINSNYVNIVKVTNDTSNTTLDNVNILPFFKKVPVDPVFSYAQIPVSPGNHTIHSDSGFNAIAYGYGTEESYAYNLGFFNQPPANYINIQNPYANPVLPQTCNATPFKLSVSFPFQPMSIQWNFFNNSSLTPNDPVTISDPDYDSTYTIDSTNYFRYSLPGYYTTSTVSDIPVQIAVSKATEDGCADTAIYNYTIKVFQKPVADWTLQSNACVNDSLQFNDNSLGFGRSFMNWNWVFGNGDSSTLENPKTYYKDPGNYNISLQVINDIGCFADTVKPLFISSRPVANFGMAGLLCAGNPITFTDSSTIATGAITQWHWDLGDGTTSSSENLVNTYSYGDTLNIKLWDYSAQNCVSDTASKILIIYSYPVVRTPLDTFVVEGHSVQLIPFYRGSDLHYLWYPPLYLNSDTIPFPVSSTKTSTFYQETVTGAGGCVSKADTYIEVIQFLEIPNVFSPNGDGINDTWVIKNTELYPQLTVQIFNRYGQPIFYSKGYYTPWDGKMNGKPLPVGVYYYVITPQDKYVPPSSGYVTILR
jgi:gliding motility-associated-like protein